MRAAVLVQAFILGVISHQGFADPCRRNYGNCDRINGLCWTTSRTTHFCTCKAGYKSDNRSRTHRCIDVDECVEEDVCDENSICENTRGNYNCYCKCGYVKDYTGQKCLDGKLITGKCNLPLHCYHIFEWWKCPVPFDTIYAASGYFTIPKRTRFHAEKSDNSRKTCSCQAGYQLDKCGYCEDVDECAESKHQCNGEGIKCINTEGSYYCECQSGYILGPCRRRCYAAELQRPRICMQPDLSSLASGGTEAHVQSIINPFLLDHYRTCPDNVQIGNTTTTSFDLDGDGNTDVTLTWICSSRRTSVLKKFAEDEARWGQWSCWTACKATCWGGLQTRSRTCLHGVPGLAGCKENGTETRSCYSGKQCPYRVRKDATTLSEREIRDLVRAMKKYKNDMTVRGFHNAASAHGWPYQCEKMSCCQHGAKMKFLAWHRTMMLNFEEGIARFLEDKTLGLPYWNWLAKDRKPPPLVWQKSIDDQENPFTNMTIRIDLTGPMRTIQRDNTVFMPTLDYSFNTWRDVTKNLAKTYSLHEFAESLENVHGGPHVSVCGSGRLSEKCELSMAAIAYAGFDPLFLFHHVQVDRLWAVAQKKAVKADATTWTTQTALEAMEDRGDFGRRHMPFGNKSINAFRIVQAVNTMQDAYFYKELTGVVYDYIDNDGYPAVEKAEGTQRVLRVGGGEMLFIAHYLKSISGINAVYVNYYMNFLDNTCAELTEYERVGRNILLPTDRVYYNSVPSLVAMEKIGSRNLDMDVNIAACYTNHANCTSSCPPATNAGLDTLPSPGLVYYLPNEPVDIYKFNWSTGKLMPSWHINLDGSSQWLHFYGSRAGMIYQVATAKEWQDCDSTAGSRLNCSFESGGSACMIPVGIYYLVDEDARHCGQGLKMIVTSRI